MNHIEQAYKAWRATVQDNPPLNLLALARLVGRPRRLVIRPSLSPTERARHAVTTYWATLTPEQRSERQRKAARKMWKRRKAERRA